MGPKIIFEDEYILIIDKPAGLTVNRALTTKGQITLQDWVEDYLRESGGLRGGRALPPNSPHPLHSLDALNAFVMRSGVVHRLDKETSGLMVIAKDSQSFENLQKQFKERTIEKKYLVLAHGKLLPEKGSIRAPISRSPFNRKRFGVFLGGREAITDYKTIAHYQLKPAGGIEDFSLLEISPKTGRTHQIRVHLKYLGHPVVADPLYAGRKLSRRDRAWCPRQFLHASYLAVNHPKTDARLVFTSPLPDKLRILLK